MSMYFTVMSHTVHTINSAIYYFTVGSTTLFYHRSISTSHRLSHQLPGGERNWGDGGSGAKDRQELEAELRCRQAMPEPECSVADAKPLIVDLQL